METATGISQREREILHLIALGLSGKQIAVDAGIYPNTVANRRKSLLRKTNSKNMKELIRYAHIHSIL
jgi:DNA-binding CsgD family transcriptional regulator